jgi:hypothetical protein
VIRLVHQGPLSWQRALALVIVLGGLFVNLVVVGLLSRPSFRRKFNQNRRKSLPILGVLVATDLILAGLFIAAGMRIVTI